MKTALITAALFATAAASTPVAFKYPSFVENSQITAAVVGTGSTGFSECFAQSLNKLEYVKMDLINQPMTKTPWLTIC
jgi:hypothetical protein